MPFTYRTIQPRQVGAGKRRKAEAQKIPGRVYGRLNPEECLAVAHQAVGRNTPDFMFGDLEWQTCSLVENPGITRACQTADAGSGSQIDGPGHVGR